MKQFDTKAEALAEKSLENMRTPFSIKGRNEVIFIVDETNIEIGNDNKKIRYITRIIDNKRILELSDALSLAQRANIHIKSTDVVTTFVDDYYYNGEKKGSLKRVVCNATIIYNNKEYVRLGSAGADNTSKNLRQYVVEIASKRAICRAIISALHLADTWTDIEFSPEVLRGMEDKKDISINNAPKKAINVEHKEVKKIEGGEKISKIQLEAINSLIQNKNKIKETILKTYNIESFSQLTNLQAKKIINRLQLQKR